MNAVPELATTKNSGGNHGRQAYTRAARCAARRESRRIRRTRLIGRVVSPIRPTIRACDPLARGSKSASSRVRLTALLIAAAVLTHAALVLAAFVASGLLSKRQTGRIVRERIELAITSPQPKPAPQSLLPEKAASPRRHPPQPPKAKAKPVKPPEPPPDPVTQPAKAKPTPPDAAQPRRIIGLSLESTVTGDGGGPAFAVGNTRMGETATRADDPAAVSKLHPEPQNRVSARVPGAGVQFVAPHRLERLVPDYPPLLRAQGIEGDVLLRAEIDTSGTVTQLSIVKSSGYAELDEAARRAAQAERYAPATRDGVPVADVITFTVRFRLINS